MLRTAELIYWISEREEMRRRKEANEPRRRYGWSDDPHMGTVRYCNVRREDDKVTRYIAENWRTPDMSVSRMVLARMVNYIPSLAMMLPYRDDLAGVESVLKSTRAVGDKIWTSAYTISTCGQSMDKVDYVLGVVRAVQVQEGQWRKGLTSVGPMTHLQGMHGLLQGVQGLGSFLAAQVVADLKNTTGWGLDPEDTPDWWTWAAHGPGSLAGLSAYFGAQVTPRTFTEALSVCWNDVKADVPVMHMQDFQNCMCEFSKYIRVKEGGHARNRYIASTAAG